MSSGTLSHLSRHFSVGFASGVGIGVAVGACCTWYAVKRNPETLPCDFGACDKSQAEKKTHLQNMNKATDEGADSQNGRKRNAEGKKPSTLSSQYRREVVCADAVEWLQRPGVVSKASIVFTSLPDESEVREFAPTLDEWKVWFKDAARVLLKSLPPGGVAVFYQTDIRRPDQTQVSKSFLVLSAASELQEIELWWHKIAHFGNVDQPAVNAVKFTHVLCFRRKAEAVDDSSHSIICIPDVFFRGQQPKGLRNSARCMGGGAVVAVLKWVSRRLPHIDTIIDPFCGAGTSLALGNEMGFHAIGVDISARRVKQSVALDGAALLSAQAARSKATGKTDSTDPHEDS